MKTIRVFVTILIIAQSAFAQNHIRLPDWRKIYPVDAIEHMQVKDTAVKLSDEERKELCRFFVQAYVTSIRNQHQDYPVKASSPLVRLLIFNFPSDWDRIGDYIMMYDIFRFFRRQPEYRPVVREAIKTLKGVRECGK